MHPKDADGIAKQCRPKQCRPSSRSSLIWVYTVCPDLPVPKLRIIMVAFCNILLLWWKSRFNLSRDMTKPTKWVCAQWRSRSAWASAQSDQSLHCVLIGYLRTQGFFMRTMKTLIRLGRCPGWSESSLGTHSFYWFYHVAAHLFVFTSKICRVNKIKKG